MTKSRKARSSAAARSGWSARLAQMATAGPNVGRRSRWCTIDLPAPGRSGVSRRTSGARDRLWPTGSRSLSASRPCVIARTGACSSLRGCFRTAPPRCPRWRWTSGTTLGRRSAARSRRSWAWHPRRGASAPPVRSARRRVQAPRLATRRREDTRWIGSAPRADLIASLLGGWLRLRWMVLGLTPAPSEGDPRSRTGPEVQTLVGSASPGPCGQPVTLDASHARTSAASASTQGKPPWRVAPVVGRTRTNGNETGRAGV